MKFLLANRRARLAVEFERLAQTSSMIVLEYEDCFSQLSRYALHVMPIDVLRTKGFIRGLANLMFTMLSSHVRRITYAEAVDTALHIEAGQMERKALGILPRTPSCEVHSQVVLVQVGVLIIKVSSGIYKVVPHPLGPPQEVSQL